MHLFLRTYPDEILNQQTNFIPVSRAKEFEEVGKAMLTTLKETKTGVGLAANQVGLEDSIIVVSFEGDIVMLNPRVVDASEEMASDHEGCLSFPGVGGYIDRPVTATIEYMTTSGETKVRTFTGTLARIIQHEIDHLNGINIIDKMSNNQLKKNRKALKALLKKAKSYK